MQLTTSLKAFQYLQNLMLMNVEEFWAISLNPNKSVLATKMIFRGTVDFCLVHPRDIFRFAYLTNASSLIIAHNHPSGNAQPSLSDLKLTRRLVRVSKLLQVPILDHLIVTKGTYYSFAAHEKLV